MEQPRAAYIGIDPTDERQIFSYAALDEDKTILALDRGRLEDVLAFCAGQSDAFIAINAPSSLNVHSKADSSSVDMSETGETRRERYIQPRLAEMQLLEQGINIAHTPASITRCPVWMKKGFFVYGRLRNLGYDFAKEGNPGKYFIETRADACCGNLLGSPLFSFGTLESRLQRQLLLVNLGVRVADPMIFFEEITRYKILHGILPIEKIYTPSELNVLICGYLAWLAIHNPIEIMKTGTLEDGQIWLPKKVTLSVSNDA